MKIFFTKILSFFLAVLILLSTSSFTVDMHFCCNQLVDIAVWNKAKTCTEKVQKKDSPLKQCTTLQEKDCCSNESFVKTGNEIVEAVTTVLHANDFEIVQKEEEMLVERMKVILIEQLQELPLHIKVKTSELLASRLHKDYKTLSKLFSANEQTTLEKYFIKLKIEKVKELIQLKQHSFSDIGYLLDYSSVNHLSRQFKEVVGMSMTDYKNTGNWKRNFYDEII